MTILRAKPTLRVAVAALAVLVAPPVLAQAKRAPSKAPPAKAAPLPLGNVATGKALFEARCSMCHRSEGVGGPMAPSLKGVYGAKGGAQPDFKYSTAMAAASPQWTAANLDAFLAKPQGFVPGSRMMMATAKPEDRRDLIAYLASLRK